MQMGGLCGHYQDDGIHALNHKNLKCVLVSGCHMEVVLDHLWTGHICLTHAYHVIRCSAFLWWLLSLLGFVVFAGLVLELREPERPIPIPVLGIALEKGSIFPGTQCLGCTGSWLSRFSIELKQFCFQKYHFLLFAVLWLFNSLFAIFSHWCGQSL